jgi:O-antigen ligase
MTSSANSIRALLVYALILPLALILGYLLATPTDFGTWATLLLVLCVICAPLILAYHRPLLFLSWNMTAAVFFLPGRPQFWLVMAALSLGVTVLQRTLSKETSLLNLPSIAVPLLFLGTVVLITGHLTGGFGVRILGSENVGGRRYILVLCAIVGFFAMIARPVPLDKVQRYVGLFFLGAVTDSLASALPFLGPQLYFLYLVFPVENAGAIQGDFGTHINRLWGLTMGSLGVFLYVLAKYGVVGTLNLRRPLRLLMFLASVVLAALGGFRSAYALMAMTFLLLFYLEGLMRSKYLVALIMIAVTATALIFPFANKLPLAMQRTLSFLPIRIDPIALYDAETSTEWRLGMWQQVLPEIPKHFWLGKGLGIPGGDLELAMELQKRGSLTSQELMILSGDYHSGPLSLVIPLGIWGVIGFIWFLAASIRALYLNYRYGDPSLKKVNTLLLAYFLARTIFYFFVFGGFYGDLATFCGIIGLGLSLNGGIRKPVRVPSVVTEGEPTGELEPPLVSAPVLGRTS